MKASHPFTRFSLWRHESFFNIDFASYTLSHHSFPRHFHDHYVIELVVDGIDNFYCNGKNHTATNNQLVLINPGEVHTGNTVSDTPLRYYSLYPDKKALQQIAKAVGICLPNDFYFERPLLDYSSLTQKLRLFFEAFALKQDTLLQQELFLDCMYELLQSTVRHDCLPIALPKKDSRIELLVDFLHSHFNEEISLQRLAELVRINPFHMVRLFRRSVGLSPYEYLLVIRAENAKQLLRKGWKVMDAASQSGFYDSSHFSRMFYKITGTSPGSFRSSKSQYRTSFTG